ncbi:hypothetical protein PGAL8A_00135300 [Plasmodium gallinaceum]|uniref:Fam-a protein n=1 Tax=Plasmodium gallinaceum TaxID=5849 RepID=A0A1J1GMH5_PLAGA|nr:hypothetical protein PGAL8A_00135300 [Plasmodium gallinaceum]CRG93648.1 hypothetical protein PGAL8A_00135300 [Plasmodium gallinaceum]
MKVFFKIVFLIFLTYIFQGFCNETNIKLHKSSRLMELYHAAVKVLISNGQIDALIKKHNVDYSPTESLDGISDIEQVDISSDINDVLSKILKNKEVKVGALKGKNWGSIGDYNEDPPTGFWPELMFLIWKTISKRIFDDENAIKVKYLFFVDVFNALNKNEIDITENYFLSLPSSTEEGLRNDTSKISQGLSLITHSNKIIVLKELNINNLNDLKSYISKNSNVKIACLTEANCKAVKDVFESGVKYVHKGFSSYSDLSESVLSKENLAGIVSGLPTDFNDPKLTIFDTLIKTSHSPFFR